jgi:antibiotic biosynthesis monooxygenase (ABM) superfamily enzyme
VREAGYVLLFRYETPEQLAAWQSSETARDWLERGMAFTVGEVQIQKLTGLEFWFQRATEAAHGPPARKMVIATVAGLYPLILFVAPQLAKLFGPLPGALATLSSVTVLVLMMTYAVMRLVTRALSPWLFRR